MRGSLGNLSLPAALVIGKGFEARKGIFERDANTSRRLLELCYAYKYWQMRCDFECAKFRARKTGKMPSMRISAQMAAYFLAPYAVANDIQAWVEYAANVINTIPHSKWLFESLVCKCLSLYDESLSIDLSDCDVGIYAPLFDSEAPVEVIKQALFEACELHVDNIFEEDSDEMQIFIGDPPLDLIPYEIYMIYRVRSKLGWETPNVEHPLLSLPPSQYRPQFFGKSDEILNQVKAIYERLRAQSR